MTTIAQVAQALQPVLTEQARALGRATGFVQRQSKLDGATFVQTVTFGWLDQPDSSLTNLCQMAAALGVAISPQGLEARFSKAAATLLYEVLQAAVRQVVAAVPAAVPLLARFRGSTCRTRPSWPCRPNWPPSGRATAAKTAARPSSCRCSGSG